MDARAELSDRQREILARVVEEYVATSAPVGSRLLVERAGFDVSSSTVRAELAELERLGLLTHPHTSAGRVPTEAGYRIYVDALLARQEPRAGRVPARAARRRAPRSTRRSRRRPRSCRRSTRLLALVSAPPLEAATVRHVDVLQLQPNVVVVVVITSTGGVTEAALRVPGAARPGPRHLGGRLPRESLTGLRLRSRAARARLRRAEPVAARARVPRESCAAAFDGVERRAASSTSAARPACSTTCGPRRSAPTGA